MGELLPKAQDAGFPKSGLGSGAYHVSALLPNAWPQKYKPEMLPSPLNTNNVPWLSSGYRDLGSVPAICWVKELGQCLRIPAGIPTSCSLPLPFPGWWQEEAEGQINTASKDSLSLFAALSRKLLISCQVIMLQELQNLHWSSECCQSQAVS